jgi:hypothetical protein
LLRNLQQFSHLIESDKSNVHIWWDDHVCTMHRSWGGYPSRCKGTLGLLFGWRGIVHIPIWKVSALNTERQHLELFILRMMVWD